MNTGQTMLTVAALTLLTVITLRYFASVSQSGQNLAEANSGLTATTIATSYIERAQGTWFDAHTEGIPFDSVKHYYSALLTPSTSLGAERSCEELTPDSADDFDDFCYFSKTNPFLYIPEGINEKYNVSFDVYYVDTSNLEVKVTGPTLLKRMDIFVKRADDTLTPPVSMSTISGYFSY